ncbi:MAG: low molecular weight phosphotyrosine protein phosphatase [Tannerella sp.]|jgi:protein-tyrosine phosphatase|nr:low molecular weight phosphotyrosine protein phosphatase [Tannerella sp.]
MKRILFVCLGNICRSPAAEGILKQKVLEKGLEANFHIDSAGTYGYHTGELPDVRMRRHASQRGYQLTSLARRVTYKDFEQFDVIIGMDDDNIRTLKNIAPNVESQLKIRRLTDFCRHHGDDCVPDPYYGGAAGFEHVIDLLEDACEGIIQRFRDGIDI